MFDTSVYTRRLEWLQEWINIRIDSWMLFHLIDHFKETDQPIQIHPSSEASLTFQGYCEIMESIQKL